jgi:hypothetical protein
VPNDLAQLQQDMLETFTVYSRDVARDRLAPQLTKSGLTVARQIAIYQHNVIANLTNALASLYPVVQNIVGDDFFNEATRTFIAAHPSRSGDLHEYGAEFADFLAAYPHARELVYLPDTARLEWRWHLAFHAADTPTFDVTRLQTIASDEWQTLKFVLSPSLSLLTSSYPLLQIWLFNQPDYAGDWQIDWEIDRAHFLISRMDNDGSEIVIRALSAAEFAMLAALRAKSTLASALEAALREDDAFDLQQFLADCIASQIIVDLVSNTATPTSRQ